MEEYERRRRIPWRRVLKAIVIMIAAASLIVVGWGLFNLTLVTTEVGYITIIIDPLAGSISVKGDGVSAQWFFFAKAPWAYVKKVYVAVDTVHMWTELGRTGDFPAIGCLTKDGLAVDFDVTVRWRINPSTVVELFKKYPELDWKIRTIIPIIRETVRDVSSKYTAMETITMREEIAVALTASIEKALRADPTLHEGIILEGVELREISLPAKFTSAIEEKMAAEQEKLAADFQAAKVLILASADANATIIRAQGTADAINSIAQRCNVSSREIAQLYITVEALKKIAETGGKINFIMIQGGEGGSWILPIPP